MNRRSWLVVGGAAVLAAGGVAWVVWPKSQPVSPEPTPVHRADLPKLVYRTGEHRGKPVRVAYDLPLVPTADPLVWEYRPGWPPELTQPTHRLHFDAAPVFPAVLPLSIVGTVDRIEADFRIRPNDVPGVVVLRGCRVVR